MTAAFILTNWGQVIQSQVTTGIYILICISLPISIPKLSVLFGFSGELLVGASFLSVANTKKELGLLAGTFLIGLATLEAALSAMGL
jgi:hypothetical protein